MSSAWSHGYFTDLNYTYGYYPDLSPVRLRLACRASGLDVALPDPCTYLELGFGQGYALNIHAASNAGSFWGADLNPSHVVHARDLASGTDADLTLLDDAFTDLARRTDLPGFDVIALHGVWSWISDESRAAILDLIRRGLKPGGIVYMSYNCLPGWAVDGPTRHLMMLSERFSDRRDGPAGRIRNAGEMVKAVVDAEGAYYALNRPARDHALNLTGKDGRYLAHEYLNADWHLPYFSEVEAAMREAKMTWVGPARHLDRIDDINLSPGSAALLDGMGDPVLRESLRDYLVNQRFRCDLFVKGGHRLTLEAQRDTLESQPFALLKPPADVDLKVRGARGEADLPEAIYRPVLEALASDDYRPKSIAELRTHPALASQPQQQVAGAVIICLGVNAITPVVTPSKSIIARCAAFNRHQTLNMPSAPELGFLASPVTGGGVPVPRPVQLMLLEPEVLKRPARQLAETVWARYLRTNERIFRDGQRIDDPKESLDALERHAATFLERTAPVYRALGLLPG